MDENTNPPEDNIVTSTTPEHSLEHEETLTLTENPSVIDTASYLLKYPKAVAQSIIDSDRNTIAVRSLIVVSISMIAYGIVIGSFTGSYQIVMASLKVTLGLLFCGLICLPSLFIFTCLQGIDIPFNKIVSIFLGSLATAGILLLGFAPVVWIFSQSTYSVAFMGTLHLIFWGIALRFGLRFLFQGFTNSSEEQNYLTIWSTIFIIVTLQMTTALRPLVGEAETILPDEKKFFLAHWVDSLEKE